MGGLVCVCVCVCGVGGVEGCELVRDVCVKGKDNGRWGRGVVGLVGVLLLRESQLHC